MVDKMKKQFDMRMLKVYIKGGGGRKQPLFCRNGRKQQWKHQYWRGRDINTNKISRILALIGLMYTVVGMSLSNLFMIRIRFCVCVCYSYKI